MIEGIFGLSEIQFLDKVNQQTKANSLSGPMSYDMTTTRKRLKQ